MKGAHLRARCILTHVRFTTHSIQGRVLFNVRILFKEIRYLLCAKKACLSSTYVGHESMLWQVPVTIATSKNPAAIRFVLDSRSTTVTVEGVGPDDWILVCDIKLLSTGGVLCRDAHEFHVVDKINE